MGSIAQERGWKLTGDESCLFPSLNINARGRNEQKWVRLHIKNQHQLNRYLKSNGIRPAELLQVAWSLLLKLYTRSDCPVFIYVDGEVAVSGCQKTCGLDLSNDGKLYNLFQDLVYLDSTCDKSLVTRVNTAVFWNHEATLNEAMKIVLNASGNTTLSSVNLHYWARTISEAQAVYVVNLLEQILIELVQHVRLSDMNLCSRLMMQQISEWNAASPSHVEACVHDLVLEQCRLRPASQAVCAWDGDFTYEEVERLSTLLAEKLRRRNIRPGSFVGLYFNKSKWTPIAMLGVLRAGGALMLLDPSFPNARLREMCKTMQTTLLLTSKHLESAAADVLTAVMVIDAGLTVEAPPAVDEVVPVGCKAKPDDAMCAVFTSGSSGVPKAIILNHLSFCSGHMAMARQLGLNSSSRNVQFASYAFDLAVQEHLATLMVGGCICIPSESARNSDLAYAINSLRANYAGLTPAVSRLLKPDDVPCLQTLLLGGEPSLLSDVETWAKHVRLMNLYGPAECCIYTTVHQFSPWDKDPAVLGTGVGARCWIVDSSNRRTLAPIGAVGELLIEGPIVGRGYVGDIPKTKASFISQPSWRSLFPGPIEPMYLTGDLVQYLGDGKIRYVGRRDNQIKIHGQRLELSEVETHLREALSDCQVVVDIVAPLDQANNPILVGFISPKLTEGVDSILPMVDNFVPFDLEFLALAQSTLTELKSKLPRYMIPATLIRTLQIPTTRTGKTDRKALKLSASALTRKTLDEFTWPTGDSRAPQTEMDTLLCSLIQEVLEVKDFSMADNFFGLGGDSITAMKLTQIARVKYGIGTSPEQIFGSPVLWELAKAMRRLDTDSGPAADVAPFSLLSQVNQHILEQIQDSCRLSSVEEIQDAYPCTALQEGLMALSVSSSQLNYITRSVYRLPRAIDDQKLMSAFSLVIERTPILRTRFVRTQEEKIIQVVVRDGVAWQTVETDLKSYISREVSNIMSLGEPLMKLTLVKEKDQRHLVMFIHHALYDGWTLPRILERVEDAYYGELSDSLPYNLFIQHQLQIDYKAAELFWSHYLRDFSEPTFPLAPSNGTMYKPNTISSLHHSLPQYQEKGANVPPSTYLKLSLALAFRQLYGVQDIVFGMTVTGRNLPLSGIDQILGPTIATVPVRINLSGLSTVDEMLQSIHRENALSMPFEQVGLQNIASLGTGPAAACRFQTLLVIQPFDEEVPSTIFNSPVSKYTTEVVDNYLLVLEIKLKSDGSASLGAYFDSAAIPESFMTTMINQFTHSLVQIWEDSSKPLSSIREISDKDLSTLYKWNGLLPEAINCCVHDVIQRQSQTSPGKLAVDSWDGSLTYSELMDESKKKAQQLLNLGVTRGQYVLIHAGKSLHTVVGAIAVMRVGCAFVLVDPLQPLDRVKSICKDTKASVIIAADQYLEVSTQLGLRVCQIGGGDETDLPSLWAEPTVTPDDTVYAVFTSGSTGKPKGVVVPHKAFLTSAVINGARQYIDSTSRVLQLASFTFDSSIAEIFYTLVHGGCVCIADESQSRNNLEQAISEYKATWVTVTPSLARALDPQKLSSVKTLALGGEAVTKLDIEMWVNHLQLVNGYGPAECCVDAIVQPNISISSHPSNIGRGAAAVGWVLDPNDPSILKPIGAVGELAIEGPIVANGYLENPERTAAAFIPYPDWLVRLRHGRRGKLYLTGDLVEYSPQSDGTLHYIGRKDNQVKIRGQRIELGEVEQHLRECFPSAKGIVAEVVRSEATLSEPLLTAFIVWPSRVEEHKCLLMNFDKQFHEECGNVIAALRHRLPTYMIPSLFLPISQLPMNISTKLDRKLLRKLASNLDRKELQLYMGSETQRSAPSTEKEHALQKAVSSVLKLPLEDIGMNNNFFQLGGDSIAAMKVAGKLRDLGFSLAVSELYQSPELGKLAPKMKTENSTLKYDNIAPFSQVQEGYRDSVIQTALDQCGCEMHEIADIYPCTAMQEGLLALTVKDQGTYVAAFTYELAGDIDVNRFQQAWHAVEEANPILRTRIIHADAGSQSFQVVMKPSGLEKGIFDAAIDYGKPLYAYEISKSGETHVFQLRIHHSLYDGASLSLLLEQVQAAYTGRFLSFSPFVPFIAYSNTKSLSEYRHFWSREFSGLDATMFPMVSSSRKVEGSSKSILSHSIAISQAQKTSHTMPAMIKLACAVVFGHLTSTDDVVYGLTLSGRQAPLEGIETVSGPTITTIPFRVQLDEEQSVEDALSSIQSHLGQLMPYEQYGLQRIRLASSEAATACEFQTHIIIQPVDADADNTGSILKEIQQDESSYKSFSSYPLVIIFNTALNQVDFTASFDLSIIDTVAVNTLLQQIGGVLEQIIEKPESLMQDISVITPQDIDWMFRQNSVLPPVVNKLLHELVFKQCRLTPEKLAISSWDGDLTYQQLFDGSLAFASYIWNRSTGRQKVIAICMEKSCWTIVAMLGVLRIGSACLMIDPSHPADRMKYIVEKAGVETVLTSRLCIEKARSLRVKVIMLEAPELFRQNLSFDLEDPDVHPNDPAFIVFTSGSTGKPKGVILHHGGLVTSLESIIPPSGLRTTSKVLHFASYAFDLSLLEVFSPLLLSATLCIPSDTERMSELNEFVRRNEINWATMTPSASILLDPAEAPSLKTLVLCGEAVPQAAVRRLAGRVLLINAYGPAECGFMNAMGVMKLDDWTPGLVGPMINGLGWITHPSDPSKLLARGAVGELLIEGPNISPGYIKDKEKTNLSFIRSPSWMSKFRKQTSSILYRTGDLVQYLSNGDIKYIGRRDTQVKVNGQRIELGEIEYHLKDSFPKTATIVVEVVTSTVRDSRAKLYAFIYSGSNETAPAKEAEGLPLLSLPDKSLLEKGRVANARLASLVTPYMIPAAYISLNQLPFTGTQKINRQLIRQCAALLEVDAMDTKLSKREDRHLPSNYIEQSLLTCWSNILGLDEHKISTSDNFFQMGGDSIAAMKLVSKLRRQEFDASVSMIFSHPILSSMASQLLLQRDDKIQESITPFSMVTQDTKDEMMSTALVRYQISPNKIVDIYPCSPLQEALMSLSLSRAGAYMGHFSYDLSSNIDLERFIAAWNAVARANSVLRTRFLQHDLLLQVVVDEELPWQFVEDVDACVAQLLRRPIQLGEQLVRLICGKDAPSGSPNRFALVIHHALYDGWSLPNIFQQVEKSYKNEELSPRPFNAFMNKLLMAKNKMAEEYWIGQLASADTNTFPSLPCPEYNPVAESVLEHRVCLTNINGITKATIIYLAWAIVVSQYSDSEDVIFGLTLSGRNIDVEGIEELIGPTLATVPLRQRLQKNDTIQQVLEALQLMITDMASFQQFGLQNIARLNESTQAACQFQNLLLVQPPEIHEAESDSLWTPANDSVSTRARDFSTYALEVTCEVTDAETNIRFDFDQTVLPLSQARRVLAQFAHVMKKIQERPNDNLGSICELSDLDISDIKRWNLNVPEPVNRCLHDDITKQCLKTPESLAVCAWDGDFTYRQVEELSLHFSKYLRSMGVGPEVFVPILSEKSRWVAIAILGVIRAGGAFILLDPTVPLQRLQAICQELKASVLVSSIACQSQAAQLIDGAAVLTADAAHISEYMQQVIQETTKQIEPTPRNALYAIFTSGSTGKPKGIVIEHAAFYTSGHYQAEPLYLDSNTRTLQFASHMFDVSVADYLWTFLVGGCVCIPKQEDLKNDLPGVINHFKVNRSDMTPSIARLLKPEDIPTLQTILLGGEPMSQLDVKMWADKIHLVNGYGPSEASVCCILADVHMGSEPSNIGHTYGVASWIVDRNDHNKLVPIGAIGELVLEGHTLAREYFGEPGKTSTAFIESSPSWLPDFRLITRFYKTGDLVRYREDGTITYVGRKDTQVKIRGQRVELGEIEHQLLQADPSIQDVTVEFITSKELKTSSMLAAFVCHRESSHDQTLSGHEAVEQLVYQLTDKQRNSYNPLIEKLKCSLPSYMVPTHIIPVARIPISASGKADRRLLRQKTVALPLEVLTTYRAGLSAQRLPNTVWERKLQEVVSQVLKIDTDDVWIDEDFFKLGGDSIVAIHLVEKARQAGFTFRVMDVFKTPKLSDLAQFIDSVDNQIEHSDIDPLEYLGITSRDEFLSNIATLQFSPVEPQNVTHILPVSHTLERYLLQPPEYWIMWLQGSVDLEKLQGACSALVQRHQVLRSIFVPHGDSFAQLVLNNISCVIETREIKSSIDDFMKHHIHNDELPLPPVGIPITHFTLVSCPDGQALIVRLSHAQFDGLSLHTIWNDLKLLYEDAELGPVSTYTGFIQHWMRSQTDDALRYWRSMLGESQVSRIDNSCSFGIKDVLDDSPHGSETREVITRSQCIQLGQRRDSDITTATIVKAAWSLVLAELTGKDDAVFSQVSNGRNDSSARTGSVVGICLNINPVRVRMSPEWAVKDLLQHVQRQHVESMEHELADLRQIVERCTNWPKGTFHQSNIVHQNIGDDLPFAFGDAQAHVTCAYDWPTPPDEILIESKPIGSDELQITLDTSSDVLTQGRVNLVVDRLCRLIRVLSSDPDRLLKSLWSFDEAGHASDAQ